MNHEVTCMEAGVNAIPVRWCLQTECVCHKTLASNEEEIITEIEHEFGEREATKAQGCPGM